MKFSEVLLLNFNKDVLQGWSSTNIFSIVLTFLLMVIFISILHNPTNICFLKINNSSKKLWNMFRANNKNTRTTSSFWRFGCWLGTYFTPFSNASKAKKLKSTIYDSKEIVQISTKFITFLQHLKTSIHSNIKCEYFYHIWNFIIPKRRKTFAKFSDDMDNTIRIKTFDNVKHCLKFRDIFFTSLTNLALVANICSTIKENILLYRHKFSAFVIAVIILTYFNKKVF